MQKNIFSSKQDFIEEIYCEDILLSIIIRSKFKQEGIKFFTPSDFSQQLGYMKRPSGYVIEPHVHKPVKRTINFTKEVLFIRKGKLKVDFYDDKMKYVES